MVNSYFYYLNLCAKIIYYIGFAKLFPFFLYFFNYYALSFADIWYLCKHSCILELPIIVGITA